MDLLEDRTAVVTGGAQGLGRAIAERFVAEGARVVIGDIDLDAARRVPPSSATSPPSPCAATSRPRRTWPRWSTRAWRVQRARRDGQQRRASLRDATMRKMTLDDFRAVIDTHVQGTWLGTRAAAEVMREQGSGSIVNMSSISGKVGNLGQTNYSAAKAGIVGLTKAAAKEVAHLGVRVNAIQPGLIRTPMTESMRRGHLGAAAQGDPDAAVREPAEVAAVACFLASDLSSYMTGTVLEVTGGRHM